MTDKLIRLIESAGGVVEDGLFVVEPGCVLIAAHEPTPEGERLMCAMRVDAARPGYEQLGELNSRLTYLSFPRQESGSAAAYNRDMAEKHQHLSVHGADERDVPAGRRRPGDGDGTGRPRRGPRRPADLQQDEGDERDPLPPARHGAGAGVAAHFIRSFLSLRAGFEAERRPRETPDGGEFFNVMNLGCKATVLTYTMSLKDFHKLFIGRLPASGNEHEVRDVCGRMCRLLHGRYPLVIRTPEEYAGMAHGEKYKV